MGKLSGVRCGYDLRPVGAIQGRLDVPAAAGEVKADDSRTRDTTRRR